MSNTIAIIPARGNSKRIPKKNIKEFHSKPIIAYSIQAALSSKIFEKVIVSTDDEEIARVARQYGAEVPFIRPSNLSDDFTNTGDVVKHTLAFLKDKGESYRYVCTLYATAPLIQTKYLIEGFTKLKKSNAHMAFSATSMPFPIQRTFKLTDKGRCKMFTPEHYMSRSQDLEVAYQDAGQFYFEDTHIQAKDIAFGSQSIPIILPRHLVQDIDTLEDFLRVEIMYEAIQKLEE